MTWTSYRLATVKLIKSTVDRQQDQNNQSYKKNQTDNETTQAQDLFGREG